MPCHEGNQFFPEPPTQKVDLIYLCCPNNPTGAAATHEQLKQFVDYALDAAGRYHFRCQLRRFYH